MEDMESKRERFIMEDLFKSLPEDILIDIASRLGGKDACKLKCVSKSWLFLISSNPDFKKLHRLRAPQRPPLLVMATATTNNFMTSPLEDFGLRKMLCRFQHLYLSPSIRFAEPCRDLMCFYDHYRIYIYSPSTTQYLGFNYLTSWRTFKIGLVYIDSLKVYKVVKLSLPCSDITVVRFEALTVHEEDDDEHTNSFELISEHTLPTSVDKFDLGNLICVNGVVYSIVQMNKPFQGKVLSLNFEVGGDKNEQKFKILNLPQCGDRTGMTLSQVKDVLCLPIVLIGLIDLWLLEDRDTSLWFKGYTINLISYSGLWSGNAIRVAYLPRPTTIDDDRVGGGNTGLFLLTVGSELYYCNVRTKEVEKLSHGPDHFDYNIHVSFDNLVSLKSRHRCTCEPPRFHHQVVEKDIAPPQRLILGPPPPPSPQYSPSSEVEMGIPHTPVPIFPLPPPIAPPSYNPTTPTYIHTTYNWRQRMYSPQMSPASLPTILQPPSNSQNMRHSTYSQELIRRTTTTATTTTIPSQPALQHVFTTDEERNNISSAAAASGSPQSQPPPPPQ